MFDWINSIIEGISTALQELAEEVASSIWNTMLLWFYETIYGAAADFFTLIGNMGADLFALSWVQATIRCSPCSAGRCLLSGAWWRYLTWRLNLRAGGRV